MRPDSYRNRAPDSWDIYAEQGANTNVNKFTFKDHALGIIALFFSTAALVTALWTMRDADRSARETKQLQIQVMDQNALLIREGLKQPGDTVYGPAGNLEYKPRGK